jgi:hypothetical protein
MRDLLGHASITTTERYDNQKLSNLRLAAEKLERGLMFEAVQPSRPTDSGGLAKAAGPCAKSGNPAGTKFQDSFKMDGLDGGRRHPTR